MCLAAALTGAAVKLMDDALDAAIDAQGGWRTYAGALGPAVLPYGLLCLALGAAVDSRLALGLFLACYVVGMAAQPGAPLPSGLPAWAEGAGALAISLLWLGPRETTASVLAIISVQLVDDWLDGDSRLGRSLGHQSLLLAAGATGSAALWLDWRRLLAVAVAASLVMLIFRKRRR